ncbi:CheR family methyltransferase [Dethiothermospora halolimnae]|uniref:CheR family methyltransferase n=1 Tax=Dethiothermospora halolimnae TaxID=3114390 RepID=UPI003CCC1B17
MEKYEKFKKDVYKLLGIDLSCYKEKQMKRRINSLLTRNNFNDFNDYFTGIKSDKKLLEEFINYLTINVSEFYRNPNQWKVLEGFVENMLQTKNNLKIWSSACSTGEEPYSLVMLLSKFLPMKKIKVIATDIDMEAISKAKLGIYNEKSLQNLPNNFKKDFFEKVGNSYKINDEIKNCVEFRKMNLLADKYPQGNDLVVCRNVLIYFTEEAKDKIYKKFHQSLNNKGLLFVGSTEQIILPDRYNFIAEKTFFYKKKNEGLK